MNVGSHWNSRRMLVQHLATILLKGRLALFLGSGISKFIGLPDWNGLIGNLYNDEEKIGNIKIDDNRKVAAEAFLSQVCKNDKNEFLRKVHRALYKKAEVNFSKIQKQKSLVAIGALLMSSLRGKIGKLVTLNYDDIIELYLGYHGFTTQSIHDPVHWNPCADVAVYHPHGFLPYDESKGFSDDIILTQESYSRIRQDDPFVQEISTIIRTHFTIYIGLSGDDEDLDRIIVSTKEKHAAQYDSTIYNGLRISIDNDRESMFMTRNIFTHIVKDYEDDMPLFLFEICQEASRIANTK